MGIADHHPTVVGGLGFRQQPPAVLVVVPRNSLESRRSSAVSGDYWQL